MNRTLERALRRVCISDGRDPDELVCGQPRWRSYINDNDRARVFAEIDSERNFGLYLCVLGLIVVLFAPAIVEMMRGVLG